MPPALAGMHLMVSWCLCAQWTLRTRECCYNTKCANTEWLLVSWCLCAQWTFGTREWGRVLNQYKGTKCPETEWLWVWSLV